MRRLATAIALVALLVSAGRADEGTGASRSRPLRAEGTVLVPQRVATIQEAVDRAEPGGLVLIAPGVYREAVVVHDPGPTIRGMDRDDRSSRATSSWSNGIHVIDADGVAVENLTARHFLVNGFFWSNVLGYRGSYLTAYTNGDYGIYAFGSRGGSSITPTLPGRPMPASTSVSASRATPSSPTCSPNTTPSAIRGRTRVGTSRS